jgi:hypothetical protein
MGQLQIIIELALQIFYAVTNDLIELRDMSTMCIKDFLRINSKKEIKDDGTNHDYRMLYQKEFFMQVDIFSFSFYQLNLISHRFSIQSIRVR